MILDTNLEGTRGKPSPKEKLAAPPVPGSVNSAAGHPAGALCSFLTFFPLSWMGSLECLPG